MKNFLKWYIFIFLFSLSPFLTSISRALDVDTHEKINSKIAQLDFNGFVLNSFLKNQLGIKEGISEIFDRKSVGDWMKLGGLRDV